MTVADFRQNPDFFPVPEDNFQRKFSITEIAGDGNCLFRALSMGVWQKQGRWKHLKDQLYKYAENAWNLKKDHTEVGQAEVPLLSTLSKKWTRFWSNEDREEALTALKTDNAWGGYIHILLFESHYNYGVYVWLIPGTDIPKESPLHPLSDERMNNYTVYSKPSVSHSLRKGFLHLLWDGISHYSFLSPNITLESEQRERGTLSHVHTSLDLITPNKKEYSDCADWDDPPYDPHMEDDSLYEMPTPDSKLWVESSQGTDISFVPSISSRISTPRPSNYQWRKMTTSYNLFDECDKFLGKNRTNCCTENCVYLSETNADVDISTFLSEKFENPREVLDYCRNMIGQLSQSDRSKWLHDRLKDGLRHNEKDGKIRWIYIVSFRTQSGKYFRTEVCQSAFRMLYAIPRPMIWRKKKRIADNFDCLPTQRDAKTYFNSTVADMSGERQMSHRDLSVVAFIRNFCTRVGECMPHNDQIRITFPKRFVYDQYCSLRPNDEDILADAELSHCPEVDKMPKPKNKPQISLSKFYAIWNLGCADITDAKWKGDFCICDLCKEFAQKDHNPELGQSEKILNRKKWSQHNATIFKLRHGYAMRREKAISFPNQYMSLIIDGCDSKNTYLPNMKSLSKTESSLSSSMIKMKLMGVRVHALHKRDYVYLQPPWASASQGCNLTLEALSRTVHAESVLRTQDPNAIWPRKLFIQMDNTSRDNKNQYVFGYLSMLVERGVFDEIDVNFLPVGHTHEDIDQFFSVLTRKLRYKDAYTFEDWKEIIYDAFSNAEEKVTSVQLVCALHDYVSWLSEWTQLAYKDFRSNVFHYRLNKDTIRKSKVVCRYLLYDYHESDKMDCYMPYNDPPPSWLSDNVRGVPLLDSTAGTWQVKDTAGDLVPVNKAQTLKGIKDLLSLPTNAAKSQDLEWWDKCFLSIVDPQTSAKFGDAWTFQLPDRSKCDNNASYQTIDPFNNADVEPEGRPDHDLLIMTNLTRGQRNQLRRIAANTDSQYERVAVERNDVVVFLVDDDWMSLAEEQEGMDPNSTRVPFSLGRVRKNVPSKNLYSTNTYEEALEHTVNPDEDEDTITVEVYYPSHGNPNDIWYRWDRVDKSGQKTSPWLKEIPRDSIIAINPELASTKGVGRMLLTAKAKERLAETPRFPWSYLPGKECGLLPCHKVEEILLEKLESITNKKSKAGQRASKKLETTLNQHRRRQATLERVKQRIDGQLVEKTDKADIPT